MLRLVADLQLHHRFSPGRAGAQPPLTRPRGGSASGKNTRAEEMDQHPQQRNKRERGASNHQGYGGRETMRPYHERQAPRYWQEAPHPRFPQNYSNSRWFGDTETKRPKMGLKKDDYTISKSLSYLLRHGAEKAGMKLMKGGFLYVDEILARKNFSDVKLADVIRIVNTNDKKRFHLESDEKRRLMIRANQGHTLQVDELDLRPITSADQVQHCIHGTYWNKWEQIKNSGLKKMGRNHIHFAIQEPGGSDVISGMRSTCEVVIYINMSKALEAGIKFYKSANDVILSPGDESGTIMPSFFDIVLQRQPRCQLPFDPDVRKVPVGFSPEKSSYSSSEKEQKNKRRRRRSNKEKTEKKQDGKDGSEEPILSQENSCNDFPVNANAKQSSAAGKVTDVLYLEPAHHSDESSTESEEDDDDVDAPQMKGKFVMIKDNCEGRAALKGSIRRNKNIGIECTTKDGNQLLTIIVADTFNNVLFFDIEKDQKPLKKEGCLRELFNSDVLKVFYDCRDLSLLLFKEYFISLDGTPVYDVQAAWSVINKKPNVSMEEMKNSLNLESGLPKLKGYDAQQKYLPIQKIHDSIAVLQIAKRLKRMTEKSAEKEVKIAIYKNVLEKFDAESLANLRKLRKPKRSEGKKNACSQNRQSRKQGHNSNKKNKKKRS